MSTKRKHPTPDPSLAFGTIPPGWPDAGRWCIELRRKAQRCRAWHPDRADYYEAWADAIDGNDAANRDA
jgi:hypothetical protein